jgi:hypothetical protein
MNASYSLPPISAIDEELEGRILCAEAAFFWLNGGVGSVFSGVSGEGFDLIERSAGDTCRRE